MFLSSCHELFILLPSESEKDACSAMFVGLCEGTDSAVAALCGSLSFSYVSNGVSPTYPFFSADLMSVHVNIN